jgi:CTP synthase
MIFTGQSEDGNRMEIMELKGHKYYVGVQYHPEYLSRPTKPSAPFMGFVLASCDKLSTHLKRISLSCSPTKKAKFEHLNNNSQAVTHLNGNGSH